ncbi:MAG: DUF2313 domain-containing protein [Oscillospiraceae bacterium]|nr:DUF2313 domain-containing protein [Oscillospiraceae bacterium]
MKLIRHLPPVLASVAEYRALCDTVEEELGEMRAMIEAVRRELVISTAREVGLTAWEEMLLLSGDGSVEERRAAILSWVTLSRPYSISALNMRLTLLVGKHGYTLRVSDRTVKVTLSLEAKGAYGTVCKMLREFLPSNISLTVEIKLARYGELEELSHDTLSQYTHEMIRNEVATNGANNIL